MRYVLCGAVSDVVRVEETTPLNVGDIIQHVQDDGYVKMLRIEHAAMGVLAVSHYKPIYTKSI